jgi:hypothetical protein
MLNSIVSPPISTPLATCAQKKGTNKKIMMPACINLSGEKSIARVTLASMSEANKEAVDDQIQKTLKGKINKEVKGTVLTPTRDNTKTRQVDNNTRQLQDTTTPRHETITSTHHNSKKRQHPGSHPKKEKDNTTTRPQPRQEETTPIQA